LSQKKGFTHYPKNNFQYLFYFVSSSQEKQLKCSWGAVHDFGGFLNGVSSYVVKQNRGTLTFRYLIQSVIEALIFEVVLLY